jgi:hypothetical protein
MARDAGLSRDQKREALRLARVPEAEFEVALQRAAGSPRASKRCRSPMSPRSWCSSSPVLDDLRRQAALVLERAPTRAD